MALSGEPQEADLGRGRINSHPQFLASNVRTMVHRFFCGCMLVVFGRLLLLPS